MPKKKLVLIASVILMICGSVLQSLGYESFLGASFLGLAFASLVIFREHQALKKQLHKVSVQLYETRRDVAGVRGITSWYGKQLLDYGNSTYKRVKLLADFETTGTFDSKFPHDATNAPKGQRPPNTLRTGRVSTPEVTNPAAEESLAKMLEPLRETIVAGVFQDDLTQGIRTQDIQWRPSSVLSMLEDQRPDLVILDERYLNQGSWQGAFSAPGTALTAEVLEGVQWCRSKSTPVYLIKDISTPEIHSYALRFEDIIVLPLDEETKEQASGARLTPALARAHSIALDRESQI